MKINLQLLIPLLITALVTIFGWYIVHLLSARRDRKNKQRELRVNYLIEAWRKLEYASNRKGVDAKEYVERPIADIQLFGTKNQIELTIKIANELAEKQGTNLIGLLTELRQDLRKELNLQQIDTPIKVFRDGLPPLS
jgi:cell division protein FtsL